MYIYATIPTITSSATTPATVPPTIAPMFEDDESKNKNTARFKFSRPNFEVRIFMIRWDRKIGQSFCQSHCGVYKVAKLSGKYLLLLEGTVLAAEQCDLLGVKLEKVHICAKGVVKILMFSIIKKHAITNFHNLLNSIDSHINFTIEQEQNGQLSFLDTIVTRNNGSLIVNVYRKPTHTDRYLDYSSHHDKQHKISTARTLLHRAVHLPNTNEGKQ